MDPVLSPTSVKIVNNIFVEVTTGTPSDFLDSVREAFATLSKGEVGQALIDKIAAGKHKVSIKYESGKNYATALNAMAARVRGVGCETEISISRGNPVVGFKGEKIESPFFITLAHELIHAYHNSYGKNKGDATSCCDSKVWTGDAEYKTIVGLPSKKSDRKRPKISENAIRQEHKLPLRYTHLGYEGASPKQLNKICLVATAHRATSIFQQCISGANSYQMPLPPTIHRGDFSGILSKKNR